MPSDDAPSPEARTESDAELAVIQQSFELLRSLSRAGRERAFDYLVDRLVTNPPHDEMESADAG